MRAATNNDTIFEISSKLKLLLKHDELLLLLEQHQTDTGAGKAPCLSGPVIACTIEQCYTMTITEE